MQKQKLTKQKLGNGEFLICFDVRPHPYLLPKEKGNVLLLLVGLIALAFIQPVVLPQFKKLKPSDKC